MVLTQQIGRGTHAFFLPLRYFEDVGEIGIERQVTSGRLSFERFLIKVGNRGLHLFDCDVGVSLRSRRLSVAKLSRHPIHIDQLLHGSPAGVALAPVGAGRNPHREGFGEVFIRMLLRVPAFHVPHILARERHRAIVVTISAAKRSEKLAPFWSLIQLIRIIESVSGFVPKVHHDLTRVFEIVHLLFEPRKLGIGKVERNPDHRLA